MIAHIQGLLRSIGLVAFYIVVPLLAPAAPAGFGGDRSSIASALNAEYKGKVLIQRQFISGNKISYDWSGHPVGHVRAGPWTTEAESRVKDIHLPDDATIVIDAERVFLIRDNSDHGFRDASSVVVIPPKEQKYWEKVRRLEIRITSGDKGLDLQGAQGAFARIFLLPSEHLSEIAPVWWKFILRRDEQNLPPLSTSPTLLLPNADVAKAGGEVHPPRGRSLPDPKYQELARLMRYQGTVVLWLVVNTDGLPRDITIVRPLGLGLDERAVEAVQKWRFDPATRDGQPVPAQINVEVNFRLN